jgi:hypothetical protein
MVQASHALHAMIGLLMVLWGGTVFFTAETTIFACSLN